MAQARLSMQQIVRQRRRAGLVARSAERELFRANFDLPPEDERHRFLFHVHGDAGVGKTFLVREFEQLARERGALTAYVDESAGSVPEALAAVCRQVAGQGHRFKELDRLLHAHRERRHEAELAAHAAADPDPGTGPSAGSLAVARAGLAGLGLIPGVGAFTGAVDPGELAQGADRLRSALAARFRSHEDVELVLTPESVLTPVLTQELADAAAAVPWIVLFFDTYERTGPFLDAWLHALMTTDRHGALPANAVVVTAGRHPLDDGRWHDFTDFTAPVPLAPFSEAEARGLLAGRGVTAEPVVAEVLRLTGGLPVLVSTLAGTRPAGPEDVSDPSGTAVELFLKWEAEPSRRSAALWGALPRWLDADVFHAAVDCPPERRDALYEWLSGLAFTDERAARLRYHDVVRAPMLRWQRTLSPRGWADRHRRLAATFRRWREEHQTGRNAGELWTDEEWRELRLAESYHLLCARDHGAPQEVMRDLVDACEQGADVAERWLRLLEDAGRDADLEAVTGWWRELSDAHRGGGPGAVLERLLPPSAPRMTGIGPPGGAEHPRFDPPSLTGDDADLLGDPWSVPASGAAGHEAAGLESPAEAHAAYDTDGVPDPSGTDDGYFGLVRSTSLTARLHRGRAVLAAAEDDYPEAIAHLSRAVAFAPLDAGLHALMGEYRRVLRHYAAAVRDLRKALALDPGHAYAWASLGAARLALGAPAAALMALDRALELDPDYFWALLRRARVWRELDEPGRRLADLDRAVALRPDSPWAHCERGDALRTAGRDEEALAAYDRAVALDPGYASAYASRGVSRFRLGRVADALADLDRALEIAPSYAWARTQREAVVGHRDG
ncbi:MULTISPECIES: tetratricopeptide repeat protein [unclassified Streptomyces]|uniref:tetratricopeptide repeat protein n=2 Tax=unclassified Streptomyces TaxID=2593676 RepID=UPI001F0CBF29|nr:MULTISPECIES: tetratricopeptide repeat protein [unclassified Streptomyces]